jgi:hypothetical protein
MCRVRKSRQGSRKPPPSQCVVSHEPAEPGRRPTEQIAGVRIMKSLLLWIIGVPISVIVLLNIFNVI